MAENNAHTENHDQNKPTEQVAALSVLYLEGNASPGQVQSLGKLLTSDANLRRLFVRICYESRLIHETMGERIEEESPSMEGVDHSALFEALEMEREAREKREAAQAAIAAQKEIELAERREIQRMILGETDNSKIIRNYIIPRPLLYGGIAAAIALLVTVFWPQPETIVEPPVDSGDSVVVDPARLVDVAVLVEQIDARWEGGTHQMETGKLIYNEPIKLVAGRARIRFDNEAEVTIQAPATFEPLADDRMRLMVGSIVGKCPTVKSRGFTVLAPNAQIVDRGTEFGVTVSEDGNSDVHVFEGRVRASLLDAAGGVIDSQSLISNDAVRLDSQLQSIAEIEADTNKYAWGLPWAHLVGRNLVTNGDFEQGPYSVPLIEQKTISNVDITGWHDENKATSVTYEMADQSGRWFKLDSDPLPVNRGKGFFAGRENGIIWQEIDLAAAAERIDRGNTRFFLSAWLGGFIHQNDSAAVRAVFFSASGRRLGANQIGPLTNLERNNTTGFFDRRSMGLIPATTRIVRIELETFEDENVADGYVDNVSFELMGSVAPGK